jgi:hypothetical protein
MRQIWITKAGMPSASRSEAHAGRGGENDYSSRWSGGMAVSVGTVSAGVGTVTSAGITGAYDPGPHSGCAVQLDPLIV